jgi:hypothetical protein
MARTQVARSTRPAQTAALDQGIAITGELRIRLFGRNLLPVQVKLLISSKDVAAQLGLDWWSDEKTRASIRSGGGGGGGGAKPHRNGRRPTRG